MWFNTPWVGSSNAPRAIQSPPKCATSTHSFPSLQFNYHLNTWIFVPSKQCCSLRHILVNHHNHRTRVHLNVCPSVWKTAKNKKQTISRYHKVLNRPIIQTKPHSPGEHLRPMIHSQTVSYTTPAKDWRHHPRPLYRSGSPNSTS